MPPDLSRFRVRCACGRTAEGERTRRAQVIACPGCRRRLFIFPTGPADPSLPVAPPRSGWRWALLASAVGVAVLVGVTVLALPWLPRRGAAEVPTRDDLLARMAAAQKQLGHGQFRLADAALADLGQADLRRLAPADLRELSHLRRQAALLAMLSLFTAADLVRQARLAPGPAEWHKQWQDHRGRSMVFDDVVRRGEDGRPALADAVQPVEDETVRLAVDDLAVLRHLPLESGRRLLFGARLHSCEREEGGGWVIRFEPDSGVLLTDAGAVGALSTRDLGPDLKDLLDRQRRWVDEHVR